MSYLIPEEIIGVPLFVPDEFDYFQVEAGGLPNGDACLIVNGAVSQDYKAFQPAPTLSPNLFRSRNTNEWSCSFWFKAAAGAVTSTNGPHNNVLFSVQTRPGVSTYSNLGTYVWNVVAYDEGGGGVNQRIAICASDAGGMAMTEVVRDGNWHLIVINVSTGAAGAIDCYTDASVNPPSALSSTKSGTVSITDDLYFGLGAYGIHANSRGFGRQWRIGKLMFHDHKLTWSERIALMSAMGVAANLPYTGSYYSLTVPATGTSTLEVELYGAAGANTESGGSGLGGQGGYLKSRHTVTAGETIRIYIGQQGQYNETAAFNGGGLSKGSTTTQGGGGGGATDIRRTPFALADRLAVAGAGGGAGAGYPNGQPDKNGGHGAGNGAGDNGLAATNGLAGGGGGQVASGGTAGGSGGTWSGTPTAGTLGTGGDSGIYHGGGGGAGIYGGGGGPGHVGPGSGGGGSGGVLDGGTVVSSSTGTRSGNGLATVKFIF